MAKAKSKTSKRRVKCISKTEAGSIYLLADGTFQLEGRDSNGKRFRWSCRTKEKAFEERDAIAAQKAKGEFFADSADRTFNDALDLLLLRNEREGLEQASQDRAESVVKSFLRPEFGAYKLIEFQRQRHMSFVQKRLDEYAKEKAIATSSMRHIISYMKLAFDEVGWKGASNPAIGLRAPKFTPKKEREVLTLPETSTLIRTASHRNHAEWEETFRARFMLVILGLFVGMRPGELCALFWDCVDFEDRKIHVRRKCHWTKEGWKVVRGTKTGKKGFHSVPMGPIVYAALKSYQQWLRDRGYEVEGAVPVLMVGRTETINPAAISSDHWPVIAGKAGFDKTEGLLHTCYVLRHCFGNLLRTIGVPLDRLKVLMGHTTIHTTEKHYLHETPHFEDIRREVEAVVEEFRLERTPAGLIDGLGIVFARRWKDEGIEIECAPPHAVRPLPGQMPGQMVMIGNGAAAPDSKLIEATPVAASVEEPTPTMPPITSLEGLRAWQRAQAKELYKAGWTKDRIGTKLGVDPKTVSGWVRTTDDLKWMRKATHAERAELIARCHELRDANPDWSSTDIAKELGVAPHRVTVWERRRGLPMPHRPGPHKIGRFEPDIRRMAAEGKTAREIAAALDGAVSRSGIALFMQQRGIARQTNRRTSGVDLRQFEGRIRELIAEGKTDWQIAKELDKASRSGIAQFIARSGLRKSAPAAE